MAPNVTSTTTLFLAEAAVCPTSTLTSRHRASVVALSSPGKAATATAAAPSLGSTIGSADAKAQQYPWKIVWRNVFAFAYLHYAAIRGFYLLFTGQLMFYTFVWSEYREGKGVGSSQARAGNFWSQSGVGRGTSSALAVQQSG